MSDYLKLEDLDIYKISRENSKLAWDIYLNLQVDLKIIIGQQFVKSMDSILANISEGYGRYHFMDKIRFFYLSRASLIETLTWLELLSERKLIDGKTYTKINSNLNTLHHKLNSFIKHYLNKKNTNT